MEETYVDRIVGDRKETENAKCNNIYIFWKGYECRAIKNIIMASYFGDRNYLRHALKYIILRL